MLSNKQKLLIAAKINAFTHRMRSHPNRYVCGLFVAVVVVFLSYEKWAEYQDSKPDPLKEAYAKQQAEAEAKRRRQRVYPAYTPQNRKAIEEFDGLFYVASQIHSDGDLSGLVVRLLSTVPNVNWYPCSPDLRGAAADIESIKSGDPPDEVTAKIQTFVDVCNRYR